LIEEENYMDVLVFGSMIGGVLLLDLLLSGDNVLVIGVAAASLERKQRWYAIAIGGLVAMILRIVFTALASFLLNIPFIQTIGAIVLLYLAQKLLKDRSQNGMVPTPQTGEPIPGENIVKRFTSTHSAFLSALLTILIADITMSLDNILAVGALSNGEIIPLIIGLIGSITVLLLGSALVSMLVERLGWILDIAALVLGWTSATMIHDDVVALARMYPALAFLLPLGKMTLPLHLSWLLLILAAICCGIVVFFNIWYRRQSAHEKSQPIE
jgi:YjbE family integral membrane protein